MFAFTYMCVHYLRHTHSTLFLTICFLFLHKREYFSKKRGRKFNMKK
jgi:hypothetical protein